jgi:hypothetical protein
MTDFFRLSASHFLMLAPQKVTKEAGTQPSRPRGSLALLNKIKTVTKLNLAAHTKRELLRDSNSRSLYS